MTDSFNQPGFLNFVVANYSGARPWIADYSGLPIETQEWSGQRFVKAWISGQPVTTTVNVDLSGASFASNVSGNTVYLTSGQNNVQMSGQTVYLASGFNLIQGSFTADISGQPVRVSGNMVSISGQPVSISGNVVVASVTTNISGQVVYLASGQNNAQISGQTVQIAGGVSVSGNAVRISGETIQIAGGINVSGSPVRISGETIYPVSGNAYMFGFDQSGATWNEVFMDTSGGHRIKVAISGDTVQIAGGVSVSGNLVLTSISGNMVSISGQAVRISGSMVSVSGQAISISGNALRVSGETIIVPFTSISGNAVAISGQVIYPVSGKSYNQAFDASGATWNDIWVSQSGGHRVLVAISGETVSASTSVSGNAVLVSGQLVAVSGLIGTSVSGNAIRISGQTVISEISGQTIVVPFTSVSGNMVSISGQAVSISGNVVVASVTTNISGQVVYLVSGNNAVQISGQTVVTSVSGIALNISGNTVYLTSGQNQVQLYAYDPSGDALRPLIVNASGGNILRVDAGAIQVSANVSGNVVYLTSGQNPVQISGEAVRISGQLVAVSGTVAASVSGNMVSISGQPVSVSGNVVVASVTTNISGQVVYLVSGQNPVQMSGQAIRIGDATIAEFANVLDTVNDSVTPGLNSVGAAAIMLGYNQTDDVLTRVRVTSSGQGISGVEHRLIVAFSGDPVSVSGNMVSVSGQAVSVSGNMVSVSGQAVSVSGNIVNTSGQVSIISGQPVSVSGNMISISGQPAKVSGETVSISGIIEPRIPVQIRTRDTLLITGASGGIALLSGDVLRVTVRNIGVSGTVMYVGGSGDYPWVASGQNYPMFSGRGLWLRDGDGITVHTSNMAFVRVVAHTSGQYVSYLGEQY